MSDIKFIDGLIVKAPHNNAPEYVKAKLSIKREELISWLTQQDGEWVNAEIKESQGGKWYCAVDTWKPDGNRGGGHGGPRPTQRPAREMDARDEFQDDDIDGIPF